MTETSGPEWRYFDIPLRVPFRGQTSRRGAVVSGPCGWGEFSPFPGFGTEDHRAAVSGAYASAFEPWPAPVRDHIPVHVTVPALEPAAAAAMVRASGCSAAKVKVAEGNDEARVEAVRDALGPAGRLVVDANGAWTVDEAVGAIAALDRAAGGLQYVEQPCPTVEELAAVRRRADVPIAADESIRRAEDPLRVAVAGAADVAVLKVAPLGGVRRALAVAEACGLPCVVSSALETSVGLAAGVALAGALPSLEFACGLGTLSLLTSDLVGPARSLRPVDGHLPVSPVPPTPDPDLLDRYALTDPARESWWRDRLARLVEQGRVLS